jgi:hypothetical protein
MNIPQVPRVKTTKELVLEDEQERFKNSYLFIDTNFKRKLEPIFALAFMEHKRRVSYKDIGDIYFKSDEEILEMVSKFVKEDYFTCNGTIKLWGDIVSYNWHHVDGNIYIFDIDGSYKLTSNNHNESKATLKLKGKTIL